MHLQKSANWALNKVNYYDLFYFRYQALRWMIRYIGKENNLC